MIDPVRGVTSYQNLQKVDRSKVPSASGGEPFSLEQALSEQEASQEGVVYEHGDTARKRPREREPGQSSGREHPSPSTREEAPPDSETAQDRLFGFFEMQLRPEALLEGVRTILGKLTSNLRQILNNFWESKPLSEDSADSVPTDPDASPMNAELGIPEDDFDRRIDALEPAGSPSFGSGASTSAALRVGISASRAGSAPPVRGVPARNTSILTRYDARGHIVTPDPSDTQRILHGDRGSRNL